jgi:hypothetical protein
MDKKMRQPKRTEFGNDRRLPRHMIQTEYFETINIIYTSNKYVDKLLGNTIFFSRHFDYKS